MEYGLSLSTPLCNRSVSRAHSKAAKRLYNNKKRSALRKANMSKSKRRPRRLPKFKVNTKFKPNASTQAKNSRGLCDLQIRARYEVLKKIVGHEPRYGDYMKYDPKLWGTMIARHGCINNFRIYMGGTPMSNHENRSLPDLDLIAALRKKAKEIGRLPRTEDFSKKKKGEPHFSTFYRHFGSWHATLRMAGLR